MELLLLIATIVAIVLILKCYGVYLSFKKNFIVGAISLVVPMFAEIIAVAKLLGKDLLNNKKA